MSLQVIKHLNTKGAEDASNLPQAAGEYEVEIEQILQTTVAHVSAFNKQLALQQKESRIAVVVKVRLTGEISEHTSCNSVLLSPWYRTCMIKGTGVTVAAAFQSKSAHCNLA